MENYKQNGLRMLVKAVLLLSLYLCITGCQKTLINEPTERRPAALSESLININAITGHIKIMSLNVRSHNAADPQSMTARQPMLRQIIVDNTPDIFGVQEFSTDSFETWFISQMTALGYGAYYDPIAGLSSPKAIFYKINRFSLERSGNVIINTDNPTQATWAVLVDNISSHKYFISNSHWKDGSTALDDTKRLENATKLVASINLQNTQGLPVIALGDFNCLPNSVAYNKIKNDLDMVEALGGINGLPTFHGWTATGTNKIDMIMSTRNMAYTAHTTIMTQYSAWGSPGWPSDHWPVMVWYVPAIFANTQNDVNGTSASSITKYSFGYINEDGYEDKIFWNTGVDNGRPKVYLAIGNGTFAATPVTHVTGASTYATTRYYYADVNQDGKDDQIMWTPTLNAGHTRIMLATTGGNFSSTIIDNSEGASTAASTIYNFADVNGDGAADKIYWNPGQNSGRTQVYLATSGGSFNATAIVNPEGASTTADTRFYYADLNGDNYADKVVWHPTLSGGAPMVYLSDGDGTFTASSTLSNTGAGSQSAATKFYFADVNGDGRADKIFWSPSQNQGIPKVYYAETNQTFFGPIYSLRGTSQSANTNYYFADINGDGKKDQVRWNYAEYSGHLRNWLAK